MRQPQLGHRERQSAPVPHPRRYETVPRPDDRENGRHGAQYPQVPARGKAPAEPHKHRPFPGPPPPGGGRHGVPLRAGRAHRGVCPAAQRCVHHRRRGDLQAVFTLLPPRADHLGGCRAGGRRLLPGPSGASPVEDPSGIGFPGCPTNTWNTSTSSDCRSRAAGAGFFYPAAIRRPFLVFPPRLWYTDCQKKHGKEVCRP